MLKRFVPISRSNRNPSAYKLTYPSRPFLGRELPSVAPGRDFLGIERRRVQADLLVLLRELRDEYHDALFRYVASRPATGLMDEWDEDYQSWSVASLHALAQDLKHVVHELAYTSLR